MTQETARAENGATISLRQAILAHLARLDPSERDSAAVVLNRFARWFGPDRALREITLADVEAYRVLLADARQDTPERLEPLRRFFSQAARQKLTERNLGQPLAVRRKGRAEPRGNERPAAPAVELTATGRDQLLAELERLESVERPRVAAELARAREDGDLRENAPYHAAKETLGKIQGRINEIRGLLSAAQVVSEPVARDRVGLGSTVVVWDEQDQERVTYTLVGPGEIDRRARKISIQSPIGRALSDRAVGDVVEVETPGGIHRYRIERIDPAR